MVEVAGGQIGLEDVDMAPKVVEGLEEVGVSELDEAVGTGAGEEGGDGGVYGGGGGGI